MSFLARTGAFVLALSLLVAPASGHEPAAATQYVIISFDGARELEQWKRSRALARRTGASFTYFLSCAFLLSPETRDAYQGPGMVAGRSNVGNGLSRANVAERLRQVWTARMEGHEIASHGCGHFDGKNWTATDWGEEFAQFRTILRNAWTLNDIPYEPAGWRAFADNGIVGFRAPYLSTTGPLFRALGDKGFVYDASGISRGPVVSHVEDGVRRFSLPLIPEGPRDRRIIAMDYNLYVRHSGGEERPEEAPAFEERAYRSFRAAFERQYAGGRVPLQLGFHFAPMNGGAYWRALERFAAEVCVEPDVRCVGYRDYVDAVLDADDETTAGLGG